MPRTGGVANLQDDLRGEIALAQGIGRGFGQAYENYHIKKEENLSKERNMALTAITAQAAREGWEPERLLQEYGKIDQYAQEAITQKQRELVASQVNRSLVSNNQDPLDRMKEITTHSPQTGQRVPIEGFEQEVEALQTGQRKSSLAQFGSPDERVQSNRATGKPILQDEYEDNRYVPDEEAIKQKAYEAEMGTDQHGFGSTLGAVLTDQEKEKAINMTKDLQGAADDNQKFMSKLSGVANQFVGENQVGGESVAVDPKEAGIKEVMEDTARKADTTKTMVKRGEGEFQTKEDYLKEYPPVGSSEFKAKMEALPAEVKTPDSSVIKAFIDDAKLRYPNGNPKQWAKEAKKMAAQHGWIIK